VTGEHVVAVVAHPDDETFGCGGTLAKLARRGHECHVLLATSRTDPRGREHWDDLVEGLHKAAARLGAGVTVVDPLIPEDEAERDVRRLHDAIVAHLADATLVLTHWRDDVHQLHRAVSRAVEVASRPFRRRQDVWLFEVPTSTDQGFVSAFPANTHVVLDEEDLHAKLDAAACYGTELDPGRTPDDLERQARVAGGQVGAYAAERFVAVRQFR
jgi:LmbE family N-acetylglucosaminyl deacetylase